MIESMCLYAIEMECPRGLAGMFHKTLFTHRQKPDSKNVWCIAPNAPREVGEIFTRCSQAQLALHAEVARDLAQRQETP